MSKYCRIKVVCKNCEKEFEAQKYRKDKIKFCSMKCCAEYRSKFSEQFNGFKKGHENYCLKGSGPWLGKKFSKEHRQNISEANKGQVKPWLSERMSKENHWNWKGGVTPANHLLRTTPKYKFWRKQVYTRDFWTCQDCGKKCNRGNIVAHHLKSFNDFPELRFIVSNGVTLCRSCHKKRHEDIGGDTRFS